MLFINLKYHGKVLAHLYHVNNIGNINCNCQTFCIYILLSRASIFDCLNENLMLREFNAKSAVRLTLQ